VAGTAVDFSGTATDAEDGPLPSSAFSWQVNFHHDSHKHDQPAITGTTAGQFKIPDEGETSHNVFYRIILTVTDSDGSIGKDSVDVYPEKSVITFVTEPPGLQITIDGQPVSTPIEITSVEGVLRTIGVITPQLINNASHEFESWSNGGTLTQAVVTPTQDVLLTANFSTIVGLEQEKKLEADIDLYPNPAPDDFVTVTIDSKRYQEVAIKLADILSRDISNLVKTVQPGKNIIPFYFGKAQKGIYYLSVKLNGETAVKKLVIVD
jgi:hypothetical protein